MPGLQSSCPAAAAESALHKLRAIERSISVSRDQDIAEDNSFEQSSHHPAVSDIIPAQYSRAAPKVEGKNFCMLRFAALAEKSYA